MRIVVLIATKAVQDVFEGSYNFVYAESRE